MFLIFTEGLCKTKSNPKEYWSDARFAPLLTSQSIFGLNQLIQRPRDSPASDNRICLSQIGLREKILSDSKARRPFLHVQWSIRTFICKILCLITFKWVSTIQRKLCILNLFKIVRKCFLWNGSAKYNALRTLFTAFIVLIRLFMGDNSYALRWSISKADNCVYHSARIYVLSVIISPALKVDPLGTNTKQ